MYSTFRNKARNKNSKRFKFKPFKIIGLVKKKLIPRTLLARFVMIIVIPTLIGQFLSLHLFYERHWYNVSGHTGLLIIGEIHDLLEKKPFYAHPDENHKYLNLSYIFFENRKIVNQKDQDNSEELENFRKTLKEKLYYPHKLFIDATSKIKLFVEIGNDLLVITLPAKVLITPTTYIFVLWVVFLTLLLLSVSLIFSKNQIKSILDLAKAAESYGRGEKIDNYKPSGASEVRMAGLAFIKMKDRIERQTTRRTQMLAMISHDLKTPLTRMKLQVELMDESEEKEELSHDITSMEYMIASYLDFARGEGGEDFVNIKLADWIQEYIKTTGWSNNYDITLVIKNKDILIQMKPHSFKRALDNIISNSVKYGTKVRLSVYRRQSEQQSEAIIDIEDNGEGIDNSEISLVFRPFYRSNKARTLANSSNVGLGLAITREIITGHYGTVTLGKSKNLGGLLVRVKIPAMNNDII